MKRKFKAGKDTRITLDSAFEEFIEEKTALHRAPKTIANYKQSYEMFYKYSGFDSNTLLEDIQINMIYKWSNHLTQNEVRPQSINHYLRDLRTFFNWCEDKGKAKETVEIKEVRNQEDMLKMYSDEEILALLEKPRPGDSFNEWRTWAVVSLAFALGTRASTMCNLVIGDVDFVNEEITLEKQKNKRIGILPMSPVLSNTLKEYIKKWLDDEPESAWLFPNVGGGQLNVGALNHAMVRYCASRGVDNKGIHALRHNCAKQMTKNGASSTTLMYYLQHSSISMSAKYVKLFAGDLKENVEALSPLDTMKKAGRRTSKFKKK